MRINKSDDKFLLVILCNQSKKASTREMEFSALHYPKIEKYGSKIFKFI